MKGKMRGRTEVKVIERRVIELVNWPMRYREQSRRIVNQSSERLKQPYLK
jgi:hypothetical protein